MTTQKLSDIFKDSFYYGMLVQAKAPVDLRNAYTFQPAITEQEYQEVQALNSTRFKPYKHKRITFDPFKMMIKCAFCGGNMYTVASRGHLGERFLYYRCDNRFCTRKKKSIRAQSHSRLYL